MKEQLIIDAIKEAYGNGEITYEQIPDKYKTHIEGDNK